MYNALPGSRSNPQINKSNYNSGITNFILKNNNNKIKHLYSIKMNPYLWINA